ncbi:MAG TPA: hypothetical protein VGJ82_06500, partial [Thermoanaerobaculia bacterium]
APPEPADQDEERVLVKILGQVMASRDAPQQMQHGLAASQYELALGDGITSCDPSCEPLGRTA